MVEKSEGINMMKYDEMKVKLDEVVKTGNWDGKLADEILEFNDLIEKMATYGFIDGFKDYKLIKNDIRKEFKKAL